MLTDKIREVFADMIVLKDPKRSEFFANLSLPSLSISSSSTSTATISARNIS